MAPENNPQTNYDLVTVGGRPVGMRNRETGVYTPAVRVDPPGAPVGKAPPLDRGHWGDWP